MTDSQGIEDKNREYFNTLADQYNTQPWQKQMTTRVTQEIQQHVDFILHHGESQPAPSSATAPRDLRLLDYACGTGMVTRALASRCGEAIGIDISSAMIDRYKALMESYPVPGLKTSAFNGNLFTDEPPSDFQDAKFFGFDIAAVGFGFHHFASPSVCIERLAERLKPGGTVLIVDFCEEGGQLTAKAGVTAHGFSEATMKDVFEGAGLNNVGYHRVDGEFDLHMHGNSIKKSVFIGRATKPV